MAEPASTITGATTRLPDSNEPDWTDQVTDLVVDVVDRIHDSTTGPLISVAKSVVVGVVAAIVAVAVLVVLTLITVRSLDLIPGDIWIPYVVLGLLTTALGLLAWGKRHPVEA